MDRFLCPVSVGSDDLDFDREFAAYVVSSDFCSYLSL